MLAAIGAVTGNDVALRALAILRAWGRRVRQRLRRCGAVRAAATGLPYRVFVPLLGPSLGKRFAQGRRAMPRVHQLLLDPADALRADVERASRRSVATLVREAFFAVVERLSASQGTGANRVAVGRRSNASGSVRRSVFCRCWGVASSRSTPISPATSTRSTRRASVPVAAGITALVGATSRFICGPRAAR
jgi:hypothetical protein